MRTRTTGCGVRARVTVGEELARRLDGFNDLEPTRPTECSRDPAAPPGGIGATMAWRKDRSRRRRGSELLLFDLHTGPECTRERLLLRVLHLSIERDPCGLREE